MFKNLLTPIVLAVSIVGFTCGTVGCNGPGEVIEGKASNSSFAKSTETDKLGRKIPDGLKLLD